MILRTNRYTRTPTKLATACLGFLIVALLAGCAQRINAPESSLPLPDRQSVSLHEALEFSPDDWPQTLYADLHVPSSSQNGNRPAILMVHGGGWEGRSRQDMHRAADHLARHGFVVMNVDYRFAPEYQFPAQLHDVQLAMHWLHENAEKWKIDAERIGAFGFSSGAHLVSLMALVADQEAELDQPYGGPRTRPYAVVSGGTPSDLRKFQSGILVEQFLDGTQAEQPEVYQLASPVVHIHDQAPPFFLFHGSWDQLVPTDHALDFHTQLNQSDIHSELFLQRLRGHLTSYVLMRDARNAAIRFLVDQQ